MKPDIQKIFDHFSMDFNTTYMYMTGRQRKEIAYLAPTLFVRWYYSALFPETILSPSTIIESQKENIAADVGFYSTCIHFKNITGEALDFSYKRNFYSLKDHPIYKDLEIFIDYITPVLYINENFTMKEKDIRALQKKLSISDRYYSIYLFVLADKLGLYKQMTSLFDKCIQPNPDCIFYSLSNEKKFNLIVDTSCGICSKVLYSEFPFDLCEIDFEDIRSFLENPIPIDDIFISLYGKSGTNIEDIWNRAEKSELNETDSALLSSIFYLGVLLDRTFIYVFGYYLRLIRPLYSYPVDFREIINSLFTAIAIDGERELEIFMPCTSYIHTPLGKLFFHKEIDKKYPPIPLDKINESLVRDSQMREIRFGTDMLSGEYKTIYKFKAILDRNKALWKKIEIESATPVNTAAEQIMMMFMLSPELRYKLNVKHGRKATHYIPFGAGTAANESSALLSDLISDENNVILISVEGGREIELLFAQAHEGCGQILYPRITEQSTEITEEEHQLYSYD